MSEPVFINFQLSYKMSDHYYLYANFSFHLSLKLITPSYFRSMIPKRGDCISGESSGKL